MIFPDLSCLSLSTSMPANVSREWKARNEKIKKANAKAEKEAKNEGIRKPAKRSEAGGSQAFPDPPESRPSAPPPPPPRPPEHRPRAPQPEPRQPRQPISPPPPAPRAVMEGIIEDMLSPSQADSPSPERRGWTEEERMSFWELFQSLKRKEEYEAEKSQATLRENEKQQRNEIEQHRTKLGIISIEDQKKADRLERERYRDREGELHGPDAVDLESEFNKYLETLLEEEKKKARADREQYVAKQGDVAGPDARKLEREYRLYLETHSKFGAKQRR